MSNRTPELIAEQIRGTYTVIAGRGSAWLGTEDTTANIAAIIRAYGAQCATEAREGAIRAVVDSANSLPADVDDGFYAGYKRAIVVALAAIRALC